MITASRVVQAIGDGPVSIPVATVQVVANIMGVHPAVMMVTIKITTPSKGDMNASSVCQDAHHVLNTLIASRVQVQAIGEQHVNIHVQRVLVDSASLQSVNAPLYAVQMSISRWTIPDKDVLNVPETVPVARRLLNVHRLKYTHDVILL